MKSETTSRRRWFAALNGDPVDRIPFFPKLGKAYDSEQKNAIAGLPEPLEKWIGYDRHEWVPSGVVSSWAEVHDRGIDRIHRFVTPLGERRLVFRYDKKTRTRHPVEYPVKDREDIKIMKKFYENASVSPDDPSLRKAWCIREELGEDGITATSVGTTPLMQWIQDFAGPETGHILLMMYPEEVEELFELMNAVLRKRMELCADNSPADILYLIENTSTTIISPTQYEMYCKGPVHELSTIARNADRILCLHMCGRLSALLPQLSQIPAHAFEAFTSPPLGDTRLIDGRSTCPDTCLIGGTNALDWLKEPHEIIETLEADLALLPHHRRLVLSTSGVIPPQCPPQTIRAVFDWICRYPVKT